MFPSTLIRFESDCCIVNGNFPKSFINNYKSRNFNAFPYTYKGDKNGKNNLPILATRNTQIEPYVQFKCLMW